MSTGKYIGVLSNGPFEVEVSKEPSKHYTFSAVGKEALPMAASLANLQAMSMRGFSLGGRVNFAAEENWERLTAQLKQMEKS